MRTTVSLLFTSLLIRTTFALPGDPGPFSDQCGPTVSSPSDPSDTCHSAPSLLPDQTPTSFGITKVPLPADKVVAGSWSMTCDTDQLCDMMTTAQGNKWYFATTTNAACELGFWLPYGGDAASNPAPNPVRKDLTQCKRVYTAMIDALNLDPGKSMGATVNLLVAPAGQDGQFAPLPNGDSTGQAVNAGYPSYSVAGRLLPPSQ